MQQLLSKVRNDLDAICGLGDNEVSVQIHPLQEKLSPSQKTWAMGGQ